MEGTSSQGPPQEKAQAEKGRAICKQLVIAPGHHGLGRVEVPDQSPEREKELPKKTVGASVVIVQRGACMQRPIGSINCTVGVGAGCQKDLSKCNVINSYSA